MSTIYTCSDGETIDLVAFRHYGKTSDGVVEQVLLANPGLGDKDPVLLAGDQIIMPVIENINEPEIVSLWDLSA